MHFGIIIVSLILILFVIPMPINIDFCNVEFMNDTLYNIQTKCWNSYDASSYFNQKS